VVIKGGAVQLAAFGRSPWSRLPQISLAQATDVLRSQSTVAGDEAALIAASLSLRFLPMPTTAAGTIPRGCSCSASASVTTPGY
jgi:NAD(P) transhydrogenase subunit alpha